MKNNQRRFAHSVLAAGLFVLGSAAQAASATYSTSFFDVVYDTTQLSSNWDFTSSGTGHFGYYGEPIGGDFGLTLSPLDRATLGAIDLTFNFKGPVAQSAYDFSNNTVTTWHNVIDPGSATISTFSSNWAPSAAQLATSYGHDTLTVSSAADNVSKSTSFIASGYGTTTNILGGLWTSAPDSTGSWTLHIAQDLVGSNHLVPSTDSSCASLLCMPAERAAVGLNYLRINFGFSSIVSAVPEPQTYAMLLAGLGLMGAIAMRRKGAKG